MDLKRKLALVTGSTSGIGLNIAHDLAKVGCEIIITGLGDEKTITANLEGIRSEHNVKAEYIAADLCNVDDIKSLTSQILERHPTGVDILINNAGKGHHCTVEEFPEEQWDAIIAINLTAPFHLIKQLLPTMKAKGWGRIVNIASVCARVSAIKMVPYTAAKHGLIGLTKGVALEVGRFGITCNAVCPAMVTTPMTNRFLDGLAKAGNVSRAEVEAGLLKTAATGQFVEPEQVSELVLFLVASRASDQMTGADYLIDSGYTAA